MIFKLVETGKKDRAGLLRKKIQSISICLIETTTRTTRHQIDAGCRKRIIFCKIPWSEKISLFHDLNFIYPTQV